MRALLVAACVMFTAAPAISTTIVVDQAGGADYETIQEGLDAAASGDTVLVMPSGSYTGSLNREIDFGGKGIRLETGHEYGQSVTVDCEGAGRAFHFHSGEDTTAVVRRFLVRNGNVTGDGGAVYCSAGSSPIFEWCSFSDCYATGSGGAIYCTDGSDAVFRDCTIYLNSSATFGGAVYVQTSAPVFYHCSLQANTNLSQGGGAAMCYLASATFRYCNFTTNTAEAGQGGGIYTQESDISVDGCIFYENRASAGGAISFWKTSSPVVTDCDFVTNSATLYAGTVWCREGADATITNSNFLRNGCASDASGIACTDASPAISNCMILDGFLGSAISCHNGTEEPDITHCYVFENDGGDSLCGNYYDNRFEDPLMCDPPSSPITFCSDSPCVQENNPWNEEVGRGEVGCGDCDTAVEHKTWGDIKGIYR